MKISLFIKPSVAKACLFVFIFIFIVSGPSHAYAGFFSDLVNQVLGGPQTQASDISPENKDIVHNSQNVPLLESSINPDLRNIKDEPVPIATNTSIIALSNDGSLGNDDSDLEKYDSNVKISTYVVKKGDTLESISKKLNVPKSTIISSNADLKKSDLLKIGQTLVILALKDLPAAEKAVKSEQKVDTVKAKEDKKKDQSTVEDKPKEVTETPTQPSVQAPVPQQTIVIPPTPEIIQQPVVVPAPQIQTEVGITPQPSVPPVQSGQPEGTINGNYIWPFPAGVGRVSQGRHADNAYDFAAPKDTPIFAIQSGTVFIAHPTGYNGGYGKYVVINFDDGRQAIFGHMNKVIVEAGQTVKQGDIIGYVGSTGKSTGPHVHIGFHGDLGNPYLGLKVGNTNIDHD